MEQTDLNLNKERERLLTFLFRKRKIILSFSFVVSAIAFGLSYLITPLYLSTAIIFPAASSSVSFSEQRNTKDRKLIRFSKEKMLLSYGRKADETR